MSEQILSDMDFSQPPVEEEIEITDEVAIASDETSEQEAEETTPSEKPVKKNKSNFKALSKSNKEKDKRIAELEAKIAEQSSDEEEDETEEELEESYDRVELLEFIVDTPGAAQYKAGIEEALNDFPGISFEKALAYSKAQLPEKSVSKTTFNTKSSQAPKTKKISDLTPEEAANANLSVEQYDQWSASQKKSVNPFGG